MGAVTKLLSRFRPATKGGKTPRGIRNNNPGNIRHSPTKWLGQSEVQLDKDFVTFDEMKYGVRAICKILQTYQTKYHLQTVEQIIERWAPPSENNTAAYIEAIQWPSTYIIDTYNRAVLKLFINDICYHENGYFIPKIDLTTGISLALG